MEKPCSRKSVQPDSTLVLTFPTPLVVNPDPISGQTCIAAQVTTVLNGGSVEMDVTGFVK